MIDKQLRNVTTRLRFNAKTQLWEKVATRHDTITGEMKSTVSTATKFDLERLRESMRDFS